MSRLLPSRSGSALPVTRRRYLGGRLIAITVPEKGAGVRERCRCPPALCWPELAPFSGSRVPALYRAPHVPRVHQRRLWCSHHEPVIRASRIYFCLGGGLQIGITTGKKRVSGGVQWAQRGLPGPFFGWCCHLGCESAKASLQTEDPQSQKTFHSVFHSVYSPSAAWEGCAGSQARALRAAGAEQRSEGRHVSSILVRCIILRKKPH